MKVLKRREVCVYRGTPAGRLADCQQRTAYEYGATGTLIWCDCLGDLLDVV